MQTFSLTVNLTREDYESLYPELKAHPLIGDSTQRLTLLGLFMLLILLIVAMVMIANVPFADRAAVMNGSYAVTGAFVILLFFLLRRAYLIRKRQTAIRTFIENTALQPGAELEFTASHLRVRSGAKRDTYIWSGLTHSAVHDHYISLHDHTGAIFLMPRGSITPDDWERVHDYLIYVSELLHENVQPPADPS